MLVDSLPHLKAKASGSLRGTKQRVPSSALAGLQDVDEDVPGTSELPEVQVKRLSSQQRSVVPSLPYIPHLLCCV